MTNDNLEALEARLGRVADVPVRVRAVIGRTRLTLAELSALSEGALLPLDRRVGDPVDVFVNDRLVFKGELVVSNDCLGVTLLDIAPDAQA
jgi:flagellar motor switch protein FliN/FliY